MRKYGCSKRNPDPKWPCEQAVVVVPSGSSVATAARINGNLRNIDSQVITEEKNRSNMEIVHSRDDNTQLMGYTVEEPLRPQTHGTGFIEKHECNKSDVTSYLCQSVGSYARIEFLFGENTHIEKTGVLENVGKDFIVLTEAGTGTQIVSSLKNIKFINLYRVNNG